MDKGANAATLKGWLDRRRRVLQVASVIYVVAAFVGFYFYEGDIIERVIKVPIGLSLAVFIVFYIANELILSFAFLLDTVRLFLRGVLPKRWANPVCDAVTVWWHRSAPNYIKSKVWMQDDRIIEKPKKSN